MENKSNSNIHTITSYYDSNYNKNFNIDELELKYQKFIKEKFEDEGFYKDDEGNYTDGVLIFDMKVIYNSFYLND